MTNNWRAVPADWSTILRRSFLAWAAERGVASDEAIMLAETLLNDSGYSAHSLACIASIDVKADEAALHAVASHFGVPLRLFDAATLEAETPRLQNPSDVVCEVGCHGVAEGAALAAVGGDGALVVAKQKSSRVTAALGRSPQIIRELPGRSRGRSLRHRDWSGQGRLAVAGSDADDRRKQRSRWLLALS
ncbi:MAG: cobalamin biosynthesis protein [Nitratireductor sp.]